MMIRRLVKRHNMELQFWGYETGNILAAIAGSGGLWLFQERIGGLLVATSGAGWPALTARLLEEVPDAAVAVGLVVLVLASFAAERLARLVRRPKIARWTDRVAVGAAAVLLASALWFGSSWITVSAVCFIAGSALLRLVPASPLFLKLGALALVLGGIGLATHGALSMVGGAITGLGILITLTGFYVAGAGLSTYVGGIHACAAARPRGAGGHFEPNGPISAALAHLDPLVEHLARRIFLPAVFWVGADTKKRYPFKTAMYARLPLRLATGAAALATQTPEGMALALANALWAVGDIAIGSLDWQEPAAASGKLEVAGLATVPGR